ncbi:unannotated protein [freshwater metagenome]|uniref:Unannotated protein n=1 Tax=freshwater metagenome TaxID=449393 RepID=A0A6J7F2K2_9ZZZZ
MARDQFVDGSMHPRRIDSSPELEPQLNHVRVDTRTGTADLAGQASVEQQAGLQRRQRPHVVEIRELLFQSIDGCLIDVDQLEIRRREAARTVGRGVLGDRGEGLRPQFDQPADLVGVENARGEGERRVELRAVGGRGGDSVDVQRRRHRHVRILRVAELCVGHRDPTHVVHAFGGSGGEPAEVVEADLWCGEAGQSLGCSGIEVPQHAVADAVIGDLEQLFLDGLDQGTGRRAARQSVGDVERPEIETYGEDGGEPADGPTEIGTGHHRVLAAVALESHESVPHRIAAFATPRRQGQSQTGQQAVVDAAAEHVRDSGQQALGHLDRQGRADTLHGGVDVDSLVERARTDCRVGSVEDPTPQSELVGSGGRDLGESGGPPTHRGTDRSQFRLLAGDDPTPCRGEVGNQNAPGHAVDHEVVGDDEQSTRAIGALEPHHLHHDAVGRNQTIGSGVELGRGNDGEFGAVDGFDRDRVKDARSRDCSDRRHFLVPLPVCVLVKARTQHVVTIEHRCHRAFERLALDADRKLKQRCLCVTAEFGAAVQHPPHDRGERHRADSPTVEFFEHHGVAAENSDLGESGHGLALEDVAGSQHQPGGLGARDQLDRHDAVAAECEERIVDADGIEPENVREQTGQD